MTGLLALPSAGTRSQWVGPQPVGGGTSKAADGMHNGRISPGRSGSDGDGLDIS